MRAFVVLLLAGIAVLCQSGNVYPPIHYIQLRGKTYLIQ